MISNYKVKTINNEDILYIYFDFNDEFANIDFKEIKENIENIIKKFIKDNNINFKGTKIAIVAGSVVVGTLLLTNPIKNVELDNIDNNEISITENIDIDEKITESDINVEDNNINTSEQTDINSNDKVDSTKNNNSSEKIESTQVNKETITSQTIDQNYIEESKEVLEDVAKIYVTVHRTNGQVITLELEDYVIGVVGAEMPASFNLEALKSQSIIARTYALKALQRNITLTDNSSTQNYKSNDELRNMWGSSYNTYYDKIVTAVRSTEGLYLTYQGNIIDAVYHSTSNGYTEDSKNVWGNSFPYLVSVESPYDSSNPSFIKEQFISYSDLSNKLQMEINIKTNFNVLSRTSSNRIENIEINGNIYTGVKVRNLLGLRSADFEIIKSDTGITFKTKGYGHGVGLSQYGANGMANNGYTYDQILKHYYTNVSISHK